MTPEPIDPPRRLGGRFSTLRLALSLVYSSGPRLLIAILVATILTSIAVAGQLLVGREILDLLTTSERVTADELAPYIAALAGLLMVSALSQAVSRELRLPLSELVHRRAMEEILDVATEVELEAYESSEFHDRLQRARMAAGGQSAAVVLGIVTIISTLLVTIGVVAVLLAVVPVLVPVAFLAYLPVALVNARNSRARYELEAELTELSRNRSYLEVLMTSRDEAKEMRAYAVVPTLRTWHAAFWETRMARLRHLLRRRLSLSALGSVVATALLIATLSAALILAGRGTISVGDAAVAIVGLQQLNSRVQASGSAFAGVHEGIMFLKDFEAFRSTLPVIRQQRPTGLPPTPPSVLEVEDLGYYYPGSREPALRGVTFRLSRGQIMAVVGANGSGKTTLAKLLCGLLPPAHGTVEWDGVDLATCDPALVRAQIAPVFQDYTKYMLTIRQAIGLGDVARLGDDEGILRAARLAGVEELIEQHPAGVDTRLGKVFSGGTDISGGQWQRLAIARSLFRDAPVVILDEPSASLDPKAEADLFDLLHSAFRDRIVVFVSHRFATVRSADLVMVLDQGDVVELGPHDQLMAAGGLYRDLFTLQAERYGLTA